MIQDYGLTEFICRASMGRRLLVRGEFKLDEGLSLVSDGNMDKSDYSQTSLEY